MPDSRDHKLKKMTAYDLENVIATALSEATGEQFEAKISNLNFKEGGWHETSFKVKVSLSMDAVLKHVAPTG